MQKIPIKKDTYMSLNSLKHATCALSGGGNVLVLNTGAAIMPEAEAMLQALHSRSVGGIREHLEKLEERGSEKFMASFYVGYGHKSIGDCGSMTLFIEGVSMLAAKAIQDWKLYSGQEASTRYIDFAEQEFRDPVGTNASHKLLETWRDFYLKSQKPLQEHLKQRFPLAEKEKEEIYEKAIQARAFDITRGFLPSGAATNLAWHTNLRQAADKLMLLRQHPLAEVQEIADALEKVLLEAFPSSFGHTQYEETEEYNSWWMKEKYYYTEKNPADFVLEKDSIDHALLAHYKDILERRPPKTELPRHMAECGTVQFRFLLDFGSFRDIQRHRAVTQRMPLVTTEHGFASWYLNELPDSLKREAALLLKKQETGIAELGVDTETAQYYIAMGYQLPNRLTGNLPALVYLVELRATRFVHPTLQKRASQMAEALTNRFGKYGLKLHLDDEPGRFDVQRGTHDIVEKK